MPVGSVAVAVSRNPVSKPWSSGSVAVRTTPQAASGMVSTMRASVTGLKKVFFTSAQRVSSVPAGAVAAARPVGADSSAGVISGVSLTLTKIAGAFGLG